MPYAARPKYSATERRIASSRWRAVRCLRVRPTWVASRSLAAKSLSVNHEGIRWPQRHSWGSAPCAICERVSLCWMYVGGPLIALNFHKLRGRKAMLSERGQRRNQGRTSLDGRPCLKLVTRSGFLWGHAHQIDQLRNILVPWRQILDCRCLFNNRLRIEFARPNT
jgi:hypothetical protein